MATKMDSAEKAFEAATLETAAKPVAAPVVPAEAAPAAKAAAPVKTKTVAAKAKPVQKNATKPARSEEHTSELQSLMRISYAVFCLKKKKHKQKQTKTNKQTSDHNKRR